MLNFNKRLIVTLSLMIALNVTAQEITPSLLSCEGRWSNYSANLRDIELNNASIKLEKSKLQLTGFLSFGRKDEIYSITSIDDTKISFEQNADSRFKGSLNRLTGKVELWLQSPSQTLDQIFIGVCRVSQRLF